eukprot:GHVN01094001.1.p1 GENE.GHVN01094001.1~~GHVN01094001.1.p1  ORF type:complete len:105 (-),score=21.83 GHVN01094001.1:91-405(-)
MSNAPDSFTFGGKGRRAQASPGGTSQICFGSEPLPSSPPKPKIALQVSPSEVTEVPAVDASNPVAQTPTDSPKAPQETKRAATGTNPCVKLHEPPGGRSQISLG